MPGHLGPFPLVLGKRGVLGVVLGRVKFSPAQPRERRGPALRPPRRVAPAGRVGLGAAADDHHRELGGPPSGVERGVVPEPGFQVQRQRQQHPPRSGQPRAAFVTLWVRFEDPVQPGSHLGPDPRCPRHPNARSRSNTGVVGPAEIAQQCVGGPRADPNTERWRLSHHALVHTAAGA